MVRVKVKSSDDLVHEEVDKTTGLIKEVFTNNPKLKKSGGLYFSSDNRDLTFIKSGCTTLDQALGGGWARRRISNIVGDRSTGKTLLAIEMAANFAFSEPKGKIRYREAESAFDDKYAAALGFPLEKVDRGEPMETVDDLFEDMSAVLEGSKGPELYIVDSLDALSDRDEMERDIDKGSYGAQKAKKLSEMFRRLVRELASKDVTVCFISQVRDNIGVTFGRKWTRSGGRALDFYSSQTLVLSQIEKIKKTIKKVERVTGILVKGMVDKNKIGLPYRSVEFPIMFGYGIDDLGACRDWWKDVTGEVVAKEIPLEELQQMVCEEWKAIEDRFAISESKYGEQK